MRMRPEGDTAVPLTEDKSEDEPRRVVQAGCLRDENQTGKHDRDVNQAEPTGLEVSAHQPEHAWESSADKKSPEKGRVWRAVSEDPLCTDESPNIRQNVNCNLTIKDKAHRRTRQWMS